MSYSIGSDALLFTSDIKWETCTIQERTGRTTYKVTVEGTPGLVDAEEKDMKKVVTKTLKVAHGMLVDPEKKYEDWRVYSMNTEKAVVYPKGDDGDLAWFVAHLQGFLDTVESEGDAYTAAVLNIDDPSTFYTVLSRKYPNNKDGLQWLEARKKVAPNLQHLDTMENEESDLERVDVFFTKRGNVYTLIRDDKKFQFDDNAKQLTVWTTPVFCCFCACMASKKSYPYSQIKNISQKHENTYGVLVTMGVPVYFFYVQMVNGDTVLLNSNTSYDLGRAYNTWLNKRTGNSGVLETAGYRFAVSRV